MTTDKLRARFAIRSDNSSEKLVVFELIEGFFVGQQSSYSNFEEISDEPAHPLTFTIEGFESDASLMLAVEECSPGALNLGDAYVQILEPDSPDSCKVLGEYPLWNTRVRSQRTPRSGLNSMVVSANLSSWPHTAAEHVWDQWRKGRPTVNNFWAELPVGSREGWLEVVAAHHFQSHTEKPIQGPRHVQLDGRYITDLASFFCAVGEAVNGPGGYFGSNFMSLADCLRGGFGIDGKLTLRWDSFAVAREHLSRTVETVDGVESYLVIILDTLRDGGSELDLQ